MRPSPVRRGTRGCKDQMVATHRLDNPTRTKLEQLLEMSGGRGGYLLDFSDTSFAAFVETCLGFDSTMSETVRSLPVIGSSPS